MSLKSVIRKLNRFHQTKDERAFDDALDELEKTVEEGEAKDEGEEDPDAIEIHNHIPGMDTARGELPEKDPPGFDSRSRDEEMPPWFKEHQKATDRRFKRVTDALEGLQKWAKEEGQEPEHQSSDESEPMEREEEDFMEDDTNLEMEDRRSNDEPSENEEMAERIREKNKERDSRDRRGRDRRDRRNDDEANKEILGELEFEAPPGTGDSARRAKDSKYLEEAFQDTLAKAEVISPGIYLPTFDRKASPVRTAKAMFALRRKAIDLAYTQPVTRRVIDQAMSGRTVDSKKMSHGQTRVLFNVVAGQVGERNNHRATDTSTDFGGSRRSNDNGARIASIADINRVNRETYSRKA